MFTFDLAIAYKWIYDKQLTVLIEKLFQSQGLSTFIVDVDNILEVTKLFRNNRISFKAVLDRGSDEDEIFQEFADLSVRSGAYIINDYKKIEEAVDKAKMHKKLVELNFPLPKTIIIPPYDTEPKFELPLENLDQIGNPFIVKPCYYTGGAEGVLRNAVSAVEIYEARKSNSDDSYLVQQKIYPRQINKNRAWIRAFWFFDEVFPVWWDDQTLLYSEIKEEDYDESIFNQIKKMTEKIAEVTGLDYFSTEYTMDSENNLYIIDYVNDQCDFRLKSFHHDGVPDRIVRIFVEKMLEKVKSI